MAERICRHDNHKHRGQPSYLATDHRRIHIAGVKEACQGATDPRFSKMKKADLVDAVSHELFDEWLLDSIACTR